MKICEIRYLKGSEAAAESVELDIVRDDGIDDITLVPARHIVDGCKNYETRRGERITLNVKARIKALRAIAAEREKILAGYPVKTLRGWEDSGLGCFDDYCKPGDPVDLEMTDYFLNVVPPATHRENLVQCGEPFSHEADPDKDGRFRATYETFERQGDIWRYCGKCFAGQTTNRVTRPGSAERAIKEATQRKE